MIKLDLAPYCENCVEFEPIVDKNMVYDPGDVPILLGPILVQCEHRHKCREIFYYMEREKKNATQK